jgi:hypothetical protein
VTLVFDVPDDVLDRAYAEYEHFRLRFAAEEITRYELGEDGIWLPEREYRLGVSG